jgi:hypothetical protein
MPQQATALRISLAEIAALTQVKRPVVSMWRRRSLNTDTPFPEPVAADRGQQLFDAGQVNDWLLSTGRGNNPHAAEDMAAFARQDSARTDPQSDFEAQTALITLRHVIGEPLSSLDVDDLLDAADGADPDDEFLYSEIEGLGAFGPQSAGRVDQLVDAAYSPVAAFEQLMRDRFRAGLRAHADTALTSPAINLAASIAVELATSNEAGQHAPPVFVDSTPGGSDLLVGILNCLPEDADPTVLTPTTEDPTSRLVRRRLLVHGAHRETLIVTGTGQFALNGPAIHVGSYPSPGAANMTPLEILSGIENTVLQMNDQQRGIVLAPASILADALTDPGLDEVRSDLLRSGRLRAIVRLPAGLVPTRTRQAQALWVLGPAHASVPIAERWTLVADLSTVALTDDVVQDLVGDLAVSMGTAATIRAHAMRFARLVSTSTLLGGRGALIRQPAGPRATADAAQRAVRVDALVAQLNADSADRAPLRLRVEVGQGTPSSATVDALMAQGHLHYVRGTRLDASTMNTKNDGARVLGVPELSPSGAAGGAAMRHINRLVLAAANPGARFTEPGDIVFTAGPAPAAMVDTEGGAVVEYAARVLRISPVDPGGLMPELVAADISASGSKDWRRWALRRLPHAAAQGLRPVLAELEAECAATEIRLERLKELTTLIRDGVSSGGLIVADNIVSTEGS